MNDYLIGTQISKFRKAAGLTQEELGEAVGISGREGSERVDVEDVVGRFLCSFPEKERIDRLCRLVWAFVKHLFDGGPEMGYLDTCCPDTGDGRHRLMLSLIRSAGGILMDIHAEDLSFVTLWPEPKDGYAAWFAPKSEYRRLFELLSRPGCLELLEYLHCRKCNYFVAQTAATQLEMPCEEVEELLKALEERQILRSMEIEMESGEVRAYELADPAAFVPFLYIARCFMQTGANYIHFGNYDNSCLSEEENESD